MFKTKQFKILVFSSILVSLGFVYILLHPQATCCLNKGKLKQSYSFSPVLSLSPFDVVYGDLNNSQLPIIVYENYLDHFSRELENSLSQARNDFNNLVLIYRPYISTQDSFSQEMALVLACAKLQNKGKLVREAFFSLEDNFLLSDQFIAENGLNKEELETCLYDPYLKELLGQLTNDARANYVFGTPTLMLGSELIVGARPYEDYTDSGGNQIEGLHSVIARQLAIN